MEAQIVKKGGGGHCQTRPKAAFQLQPARSRGRSEVEIKHHVDCRMVAISDDPDGTVRVTLHFLDGATTALPCTFRWFLKWRHEVGDAVAIQVLGSRRLDIWEDDGVVVNMLTLPRAASGGASRHGTAPQPPSDDRGQVDDERCVGKARGDLEEVEILLDVELPWLSKKEREMLQSFIHQLRHGHALSSRQESFLETLRDRADRRRRPKFYRG